MDFPALSTRKGWKGRPTLAENTHRARSHGGEAHECRLPTPTPSQATEPDSTWVSAPKVGNAGHGRACHTPRGHSEDKRRPSPGLRGGGGHVLLTGAEPQNPNCIFPPCAHRLLPQEKPSTRRQATATRTFRTLAAALSQQPAEHKPGDPPQETRQQTTARSGNADPPQQNLFHRWHGLREHHATPSDKPLCAREDLTDV